MRRAPVRQSSPAIRWLLRAPLLIAALILTVSSLVLIVRTLRVQTPARAWDSALIVDAARAAAGKPVYEDPQSGHATLMYGPLLPYVYAGIFKATGPSNMSPRVVTVLSVIALLALMVITARRAAPFPGWLVFVGVALLLAADGRTEYRYSHVRPDMIALLVSFLALIALYRGHVRRSRRWFAIGIAGMLVAVLFKQQMAVVAFIPAIPLLLDRGLPLTRRLLLAALPPLAGFLLLLALRFGAPQMYFYMVTLGGAYTIFPKFFIRSTIDFAIGMPLFLALLLHATLQPSSRFDRTWQPWVWALSAVAVTIPTSALSFAKLAGAPNSWLPALLAVLFACMLFFRDIAQWLDDDRLGFWRRFGLSALLATLVLLCFPGLKSNFIPIESDANYRAVIEAVRQLPPGRVESPEDPTIALHARGHFGRSLYVEYDANPVDGHWPLEMPEAMARDILASDYLVEVRDPVIDFFGAEDVARMGFAPVKRFGRYTLWQRR